MKITHSPWEKLGIENELLPLQDSHHVAAQIIKNLHYLLNTRKPSVAALKALKNNEGILGFGLDDLSRFNPESPRHSLELCQLLKAAIKQYEPRLQRISIELIKSAPGVYYELVFRITAVLHFKDFTNDIQLESRLSLDQLNFSLKEI